MTVTAIYSSAGFTWDLATETSFASGTVGAWPGDLGVLGLGANFTSYELDNAWLEAYSLGLRQPQAYYTQGLSAQTNLEFLLCNDGWNFWNLVLPNLGSTTAATYAVSTVLGSTVNPVTAQISLGTPQGQKFVLGGIIFTQAKVTVPNADAIKVTLSGLGTTFSSTTGSVAPGTIPTQLLTWKDVTIQAGTGVGSIAASFVQNLDFTVTTGAKQYYVIGSPYYQAWLPLEQYVEVNVTAFHQDANMEYLFDYLAATQNVGGTVVVNIGTHTATFAGCYVKKGVMSGLNGAKEVMDALTFRALNLTIV
jgi:hypothetical protein